MRSTTLFSGGIVLLAALATAKPFHPIFPDTGLERKDDGAFVCPSKGNFPDPSSCGSYYACLSAGNPGSKTDCPTPTGWNAATGQCDWSEKLSCQVEKRAAESFTCPYAGQFPNPDSCRSFYSCYDGESGLKPTLVRCNDGDMYLDYEKDCVENNTGCQ